MCSVVLVGYVDWSWLSLYCRTGSLCGERDASSGGDTCRNRERSCRGPRFGNQCSAFYSRSRSNAEPKVRTALDDVDCTERNVALNHLIEPGSDLIAAQKRANYSGPFSQHLK